MREGKTNGKRHGGRRRRAEHDIEFERTKTTRCYRRPAEKSDGIWRRAYTPAGKDIVGTEDVGIAKEGKWNNWN